MRAKKDTAHQAAKIKEDTQKKVLAIRGISHGKRVPSRILEEQIQQAVQDGVREIHVIADGQHGIGGRIWPRGETVKIVVEGPVGQRLGSMGMFGTDIIVKGSASDDIGWINCGAKITVLGDVTNGAFNAAAQGILYVQGSGGARCDTMTKHNPRFDPPQSWYFRNVGDSFAEFKAGGIAVVCGVNPRDPENVLGYRPCVGMVGGTIYFRGPLKGYSERNVKLAELTPQDWEWLTTNMRPFLEAIDRETYYGELTKSREDWQKLIAYTPQEKRSWKRMKISASEFRKEYWEKSVGQGGIFAEYIDHDLTVLPYVTTGKDRRNRPVWANEKYAPPCAYACPTQIPSHKRATLIRQGKLQEALELVLQYSPLPATVCGEICPNLCMNGCTRGLLDRPLNIDKLGALALDLPAPKREKPTGHTVAVIGGGPAGLSAAWQLGLKGHSVDLYEATDKLGGKLELCIPRERLPQDILQKELSRFAEIGVQVHLGVKIDLAKFEDIHKNHEIVVVACGAHKPRIIAFPGSEHIMSAYDFLRDVNRGKMQPLRDKKVVIIGAGSRSFGRACLADVLGNPELQAHAPELVLVDLDPQKLEDMRRLAERIKAFRQSAVRVTATTDRAAALPGADYVLISVTRCRYQLWEQDYRVPLAHGFMHAYGENGGPGALFHALRSIHLMLEAGQVHGVGNAPHHVEDDRPRVRRGRDVEEHQLGGALRVVAGGGLDGVARVAQRHEAHALHDPAAVDVEAGDDALRQHQRLAPPARASRAAAIVTRPS